MAGRRTESCLLNQAIAVTSGHILNSEIAAHQRILRYQSMARYKRIQAILIPVAGMGVYCPE